VPQPITNKSGIAKLAAKSFGMAPRFIFSNSPDG
jgi:hypothetical protein